MANDNIGVVDYDDYMTVLFNKGKIDGVVTECKADEFFDSLDEDLKVSLSKAKGIILEFKINKNVSLFGINDIIGKIGELTSPDTDIIFRTNTSDDLEENMMSYGMILTGL